MAKCEYPGVRGTANEEVRRCKARLRQADTHSADIVLVLVCCASSALTETLVTGPCSQNRGPDFGWHTSIKKTEERVSFRACPEPRLERDIESGINAKKTDSGESRTALSHQRILDSSSQTDMKGHHSKRRILVPRSGNGRAHQASSARRGSAEYQTRSREGPSVGEPSNTTAWNNCGKNALCRRLQKEGRGAEFHGSYSMCLASSISERIACFQTPQACTGQPPTHG